MSSLLTPGARACGALPPWECPMPDGLTMSKLHRLHHAAAKQKRAARCLCWQRLRVANWCKASAHKGSGAAMRTLAVWLVMTARSQRMPRPAKPLLLSAQGTLRRPTPITMFSTLQARLRSFCWVVPSIAAPQSCGND